MTRPELTPMTLTRFSELLDAYGAHVAQWPEEERAAAERFVQADAEAATLFARAQELDGLLDRYEVADVSPRLRARVLEVPTVAARGKRKVGWRLAWAVAFSCFVGVAAGALTAPEEAAADDTEWAELTEVSFYSDVDLTADEDEP